MPHKLVEIAEECRKEIYAVMAKHAENAEGKRLLHGNGHHIAQYFCEEAYWTILDRSTDLKIRYSGPQGGEWIYDCGKQSLTHTKGSPAPGFPMMKAQLDDRCVHQPSLWKKEIIEPEMLSEADFKERGIYLESYGRGNDDGHGYIVAHYLNNDAKYCGVSLRWSRQPMIDDPFPTKEATLAALQLYAKAVPKRDDA